LRSIQELIPPPPPQKTVEDEWEAIVIEMCVLRGDSKYTRDSLVGSLCPFEKEIQRQRKVSKDMIADMEAAGWQREKAELFCALYYVPQTPLSRALRERDPVYSATLYVQDARAAR